MAAVERYLADLGIACERHEHPAVATVAGDLADADAAVLIRASLKLLAPK